MGDASRYQGKVAFITGGASGIGEEIGRRLIAEGGSILAADINQERLDALAAELGDRFVGVRTDVTVEDDVATAVAATIDHFGSLDVAFNVAGAPLVWERIAEADTEKWVQGLQLNLVGVFRALKYEAAAMIERGKGGAIVNVASLNSRIPSTESSSYSTAKAGVEMLTQCAALELGISGIRVNAISPGLTDTPLSHAAPQAFKDAVLARVPLEREGKTGDQAEAALYLASDQASYVTGVNLFVDGGWALTTFLGIERPE